MALVTGGGRGIGRATALALSAEGAVVAVVARSGAELSSVVQEAERLVGRVVAIDLDLTAPGACHRAIQRIGQLLGTPSILINNAARIGPFGVLAETDADAWEQALTLNLVVPYRLCRLLLPAMLASGWGRIVNVTSLAGRKPSVRFGAYSVSKAGLDMLTRQLAEEVAGTGVAVVGVNPGMTDTAMNEAIRSTTPELIGDEVATKFAAAHAAGTLRQPEHVASVIIEALVRGEDPNGQMLDLDHGFGQAKIIDSSLASSDS